MLAHCQMARLTFAAIFEGHDRLIKFADGQDLVTQKSAARCAKRLNLQHRIKLNNDRRNHQPPTDSNA